MWITREDQAALFISCQPYDLAYNENLRKMCSPSSTLFRIAGSMGHIAAVSPEDLPQEPERGGTWESKGATPEAPSTSALSHAP